jgi:hypothetical protein
MSAIVMRSLGDDGLMDHPALVRMMRLRSNRSNRSNRKRSNLSAS